MDERGDPAIADGKGPFPDFPDAGAAVGREKDDFRLADKILERHIPDMLAAVLGIIAVVAHHEVMAFGYDEHLRGVEFASWIAVEHIVAFTPLGKVSRNCGT